MTLLCKLAAPIGQVQELDGACGPSCSSQQPTASNPSPLEVVR